MFEIHKLLRAARENLGMDVAFVSQFDGDKQFFRHVDAGKVDTGVCVGGSRSRGTSFCQHVVDGRLPAAIPDVSADPLARYLPAARDLSISSYIGVPVFMPDGALFGTFCCFGHEPRPSLDGRDVALLRTFAEITADRISQDVRAEQSQLQKEQRIRSLLKSEGPSIVYQPVFTLHDMSVAGAEALSRFPRESGRPVDLWFKDAADVGLQVELELLAIRNALEVYREVWRTHPIQLGLNASAATIIDKRLQQTLEAWPRDRIVIEVTEHEEVRNYVALLEATRQLRQHGTKIAIDDVGAGYASMRHVLTLRPDILKLDVGLVRSVDADDLRVALISSLTHFADKFDCRVVAEGVETREELLVLRQLGVQAVQGYAIARPGEIGTLRAILDAPPPDCMTGSPHRLPRPA